MRRCAPAQQAGQREATRRAERQRCTPSKCIGQLRRDLAKCMRAAGAAKATSLCDRERACDHDVLSGARRGRRSHISTSADARKTHATSPKTKVNATGGEVRRRHCRSARRHIAPIGNDTRPANASANSEETWPGACERPARLRRSRPARPRARVEHHTCSRVRETNIAPQFDVYRRSKDARHVAEDQSQSDWRRVRPGDTAGSARRRIAPIGNDARHANALASSEETWSNARERPARQRRRRLVRPERTSGTPRALERTTERRTAIRRLPTIERRTPRRRRPRSTRRAAGRVPVKQARQRELTSRLAAAMRASNCIGQLRRDVAECVRAVDATQTDRRRSNSNIEMLSCPPPSRSQSQLWHDPSRGCRGQVLTSIGINRALLQVGIGRVDIAPASSGTHTHSDGITSIRRGRRARRQKTNRATTHR